MAFLLEHGKSVDLGENVWPQLCVNKAADRHLTIQPERVAAQFHLLAIIQGQPKPLWIELRSLCHRVAHRLIGAVRH